MNTQGDDSIPINYKDFLCPLDAITLEDADRVVSLYDMPLLELAKLFTQKHP
jgi:hypothetical protein